MQAMFLFVHTVATGTRAPHFTHLRWQDVQLVKVPMRAGDVVAAGADTAQDPLVKVSVGWNVVQLVCSRKVCHV